MPKGVKGFQKGIVTNPKGRPKKVNDIGRYIRKRLEKMPEGKDRRYIYYLITSLLKKGTVDGDMIAVRELLDRAYGKPKQKIEMDINPKKELDRIKNLIDEKHKEEPEKKEEVKADERTDGKEQLVSGHSADPLQEQTG